MGPLPLWSRVILNTCARVLLLDHGEILENQRPRNEQPSPAAAVRLPVRLPSR